MKKTIFLLALCLCGSAMLRAQTTIVNFDFNSGISYATITPELAAGINAEITCTEGFQTYAGTEPGSDAFSPGNNAGSAAGMANSSGTKTRYWTIHLSGTALMYCDNFKCYIQAQRTNDGARSVELAYSTDGVSFTEPGMTMAPGNNSFKEHVFDLSGISLLSGQQDIYIRIMANRASGSGQLLIDNFQVQAQMQNNGMNPNSWNLMGNNYTDENVNFIGTTDSSGLTIKTNNTTRMQISADGEIGISGRLTSDSLHVLNRVEVGNSVFIDGYGTPGSVNHIYTDDTGGTPTLYIQNTAGNDYNTVFSAANSGNVGIGTDPPQTKLDVAGQITSSALAGAGSGATATQGMVVADNAGSLIKKLNFTGSAAQVLLGDGTFGSVPPLDPVLSNAWLQGGNVNVTSANNVLGTVGNFDLDIRTNGTPRMYITANPGNIGIGTTNPHPLSKLHLHDATAANVAMLFTNAAAVNGLAIGITGSGTAQFRMIDEQPMEFFTNDIRRMIINKDNGYVGIGAFSPLSPPAFQLDVVGDVNIGPATAGYFINTQEVLKYHGVAGNYSETNIYVGVAAGVLATTGVHNTYVGYKAGNKNEFETDNTFIGFCSGMNTCSGQGNTFLGSMTGMSNDTGEGNVFIGVLAGQANIEADYNTFVGNVSGHDNTMGYSNSFYGKHSGYSNTTGNFNCYLGTYSGAEAATDNNWNTCVGSRSGVQCEGNYNVMSGSNAGAMSHGNNNVFSGTFAGFNSQRHYNVISGQGAGYNNNGDGNVILGAYKGYTTIGNKNCFIGVDDALGLGSYFYSHGDFNICLGADARNTSTDINILDNSIVIGYDAVVTNSNSMILGNNKVNVGIGLSGESDGPQSKLEINADDDGVSGLQFRRLTTATDPGGNPGDGVLAVDIDGKVIYVEQSAGVAGPTGATGDAGVAGPTGAAGIDGLPGVTGPQGVAGLPGATGVAGATGIAGVAGATGATGTPGASEADNGLQVSTGDYCTPTPHVELGGELHKDTEVKLYHNLWGSHNLFFTGQAATNTIGDYQHRNVAVGNYWGERLSAKFNVRQRSGVPTWGSIAVNVLNDYSGLIKDTEAIGVNSETSGNNSYSGLNFGVKAKAKNGMRNYAVWAQVYQSSGLSLANYAIWGQAANPHLLPGAAITNWAGWFVGNLNVTGSTYHLSSDIKLKDSISNITGALELLKKIHPKTFKFKTDDYSYMSLPGGLQYGVIANEVDTVIPSLVGNLIFPEQIDSAGNIINPELEYKGMNYIGLIPILTQGIKELDSLVTDLASPPPAPMLASPADGSTDLPTNLIFNWHPSSRALTYRFILSTTPDASGIVEDITISDTTQEVRRLVAGTTYYWLVIAKNQNGSSELSEMWSFTTKVALHAPVLIEPVNNSTDIPVSDLILKWHPSVGADYYRVRMFDKNGSLIADIETTDTTFNYNGILNYKSTYYWSATAINEFEQVKSEYAYFWTEYPPIPTAPVLISPINGDITVPVGDVTLTWSKSELATCYYVYISGTPDFNKVSVYYPMDTILTLNISDYSTDIYWYVQAWGEYGISDDSETWYFATEDGFPILNAQGVFELSDATLKQDIAPIPNALELTTQLQGVSYSWNLSQHPELKDSSRQLGLIAQEVQRVLPEVVKTNDQGYLYIDYNRLVPVLIEAVKEQQGTIEAQQAAIDSLKTSPCCNTALLDSILEILNNLPPGLLNGNGDKNNAMNAPANITQTIVELETIQSIILDQNVPNPFAESTVIAYSLPETVGEAMIVFADISGNVIKTVEITQRGKGELKVFAQNLSAGTYVYYLIADDQTVETRKMVRSK